MSLILPGGWLPIPREGSRPSGHSPALCRGLGVSDLTGVDSSRIRGVSSAGVTVLIAPRGWLPISVSSMTVDQGCLAGSGTNSGACRSCVCMWWEGGRWLERRNRG
ncbi:hypothetical protein ACOMHN_026556 [Nucella lapillus]